MYRCKHFLIQELVSEAVFNKYGSFAWNFFDPRLLETMDFICELFGSSAKITINNWLTEKNPKYIFDERGLRENTCPMMRDKTKKGLIYLSGHPLGKAFDFDVEGYSAEETRQVIIKSKHKLPYPIRLEKDVTWVHLDIYEWPSKLFITLTNTLNDEMV